MPESRRLIDVSHTVEDGKVTYKGLPGPVIRDHLSRVASRPRYAPGTEFHIGTIEMVGNTGTYLDSPFHRYADGKDLAALALAALVGIDSFNIDGVATGERPVHSLLLANDIPIVEHLCGLAAVPERGSRFFAVPVKVKAFGTFPVHAFVLTDVAAA